MEKLLIYFLNEPEREFHIRELAKLTRMSPTTVAKYLEAWKKEGLLISRKRLNHSFFKANNEGALFRDKKLFCNLRMLRKSGLIDYLIEAFNYPEAIILFGSFRKAEDIPRSDIDLLVVAPVKKRLDLKPFERKLNHKIEIFQHSAKEIEMMKQTNKEIVNNWINGIALHGFWELLR